MKIPDSIRIGGIEYAISLKQDVNNGAKIAYGQIDYDRCEIELSSSIPMNHQRLCTVLWHEILHGIREHAGLEIKNEEEIVEMFSKGIYQVLQDNGRRLFDIIIPPATPTEEGDK